MASPIISVALPLPVETPVINGWGQASLPDDPDIRKVVEWLSRNPQSLLLREPWANYLTNNAQTLSLAASRVGTAAVTNQNATIGSTPIPAPDLSSGFYLVSYFAEITTAGSVTSQLDVALSFTHDALTKGFAGASIVNGTSTTVQSNTYLIAIDANTPVTYSTTYASNAAGTMRYSLTFTLSAVQV